MAGERPREKGREKERETETEKAEAASISMIRGESRASALVNVGTR